MFGTKKNRIKEETKVKDKTETLEMIEDNIRDRKAVCPVIFTSIGNCKNLGVSDLPINLSASINLVTDRKRDIILDPLAKGKYPKSDIGRFQWTNTEIIAQELTQFIASQIFTSFCNAINYNISTKYPFLSYFPLKEFAWEEIQLTSAYNHYSRASYSAIVDDCVYYADSAFGNKIEPNTVLAYFYNGALQLTQIACSNLCNACERAVNEILLQVHCIPNINVIFKEISKCNSTLEKLYIKNSPDYAAIAATFVKGELREIVNDLVNNTISKLTMDSLCNIPFTGFSIYQDYIDENKIENPPRNYDEPCEE